jgi:aryl-alcohol dehydrogenase-like predicted oxidoreductase
MEHTRLGSSGLVVTRLSLGCMSFGDKNAGRMTWILNDDDAAPIFRQAMELGITFWDTANIYGYGTSEEVVGRAIRNFTRREDIVLATKLFQRMYEGPGGGACRGEPYSSRSTPRCSAWARTTSTCCRSTGSTPRFR